jgi:cytochrome b pre-mRNA-processing protein 3
MLSGLFARLTSRPARGSVLFTALVGIAREPGWYIEGEIPDTIDGRFAVLASVVALTIVRLEAGGEAGQQESVALTERFVEAMDHEHRQLGIGDPTLGKIVRKLVGRLARRVALWKEAGPVGEWPNAVKDSIYRDETPSPEALRFSEARLHALWEKLQSESDEAIGEGTVQ